MEHPFDTFSRSLAARRSRRGVLKHLGAAFVGALTASLPRRAAQAHYTGPEPGDFRSRGASRALRVGWFAAVQPRRAFGRPAVSGDYADLQIGTPAPPRDILMHSPRSRGATVWIAEWSAKGRNRCLFKALVPLT
jgi:hypothetical protein